MRIETILIGKHLLFNNKTLYTCCCQSCKLETESCRKCKKVRLGYKYLLPFQKGLHEHTYTFSETKCASRFKFDLVGDRKMV